MNLLKKRWLLLTAACVINLCAGSIYAWSVFAPPLAERLSLITGTAVTAGSLAAAFSLANGIAPIPMILGGWINDRFGPRAIIPAGGIVMGLGFYLAATAVTPLELILGYGLGFGLGLGLVYGSSVNTTLKFFPDHRGLAGGIATAVYGLSSVILPPVAHALIETEGIEAALLTLGGVFAIVIVAGGLLLEKCPDAFAKQFTAAAPGKQMAAEECDWRGMLRSTRFPPMVALMLCGAIPGMMIISHCWSLAKDVVGLDAAAASAMVSMLALANVFGRLLVGALSDKFGRLASLSGALILTILATVLLSLSDQNAHLLFSAGILAIGLSFGAFMGIYPGFTAEEFGAKNNSVNYGIMFSGFSVAGFAGPMAMNMLKEAGMSYQTICLLAGTLAILGLGFAYLFVRAKKAAYS
ncbi:OFA family MFS transporter [Sutterella faecalis]|uniref:OFA family MFS transporter n=2 Tax=Sutterella TaxID=40544 RepID=A0AAI9SCN9_9BURK|nr:MULTISPECIES: OFA family MFS transporter [Sutterella]KAB7651296.1 OFA family MFS transporter [Sutterella seckii]QDA55381.1 OFA family MFS transporter [Sutterella faecalis]